MKEWAAPDDLSEWSLADLIGVRSVLWMMRRYAEASQITAELRRRKFTC